MPFDSDRKLMSTAHNMNDALLQEGHMMIVKGAVDVLLERMDRIRVGNTVRKMTDSDREDIAVQNMQFSREGLRVLAFAYKQMEEKKEIGMEDEDQLIFIGLIAMMDPPREESRLAVEECRRAGIRPIMITGDHKITAAAIAKRIGILKEESEACEGAVIEDMSDEELQDFVEGISVYARVSPEHKIRIVRAWQEKGNIVAMTGDGVNDAPALKQADIGVAMGVTGSEVAKDAAAMVLTDDNFATIVKAVENGRNLYQHIKNADSIPVVRYFGAILVVLCASVAGLPGSICTGASAVHQSADRQSAGNCTGSRTTFQSGYGAETTTNERVNPYKAISAEYRNGRSKHRRNDDGCIPERIHKPECSSCKYDGIRNLMHEPSGAWI